MPVKFLIDTTILTSNLAAPRFGSKTSVRLVNRGPGFDQCSSLEVTSQAHRQSFEWHSTSETSKIGFITVHGLIEGHIAP